MLSLRVRLGRFCGHSSEGVEPVRRARRSRLIGPQLQALQEMGLKAQPQGLILLCADGCGSRSHVNPKRVLNWIGV